MEKRFRVHLFGNAYSVSETVHAQINHGFVNSGITDEDFEEDEDNATIKMKESGLKKLDAAKQRAKKK